MISCKLKNNSRKGIQYGEVILQELFKHSELQARITIQMISATVQLRRIRIGGFLIDLQETMKKKIKQLRYRCLEYPRSKEKQKVQQFSIKPRINYKSLKRNFRFDNDELDELNNYMHLIEEWHYQVMHKYDSDYLQIDSKKFEEIKVFKLYFYLFLDSFLIFQKGSQIIQQSKINSLIKTLKYELTRAITISYFYHLIKETFKLSQKKKNYHHK
ncbi:unnamed protein product [Paramecium octaurelia]|uniref:Uncharacterized protein n=1 Tax=Paramecium octaurelia TaxID=43137 RepID=A0A8S1SZD1_PAROT|nr:unnamed protein product [Paramecium octaurelia]